MRWWIEKQMQEHISAESERKEFEKAQEAAILSRDKHAMKIAQMEQDCRRKLNEATARFNQAMVGFSSIYSFDNIRQLRVSETARKR